MDDIQVTVPLGIPDVRILQTAVEEQGALVITIESTKEGTRCRKCGKQITKLQGQEEWSMLRYSSAFGRPTFLRYQPHRYQCQDCEGYPTTTQRLAWQDGIVLMVS